MKIKIVIVMAGVLGFSGVWASSDKSEKPKSTEQKKTKETEISYAQVEERVAKGAFGMVKDAKHWPYIYLPVWTKRIADDYPVKIKGIIRTNGDGTIVAQRTGKGDYGSNEITLYNFVTKKTTSFVTKDYIEDFVVNNDGSIIVTLESDNESLVSNFYTNGVLDEEKSGDNREIKERKLGWAVAKNLSSFFIGLKWNKGTKIEIFDSKNEKINDFMLPYQIEDMTTQQGDTLVILYFRSRNYYIDVYKRNIQNKLITYEKIGNFESTTGGSKIMANNDASIIVNGKGLHYRTKDNSYQVNKYIYYSNKPQLLLVSSDISYTMNSNGSVIFTDEAHKLHKYTNIVLEYWNQLTGAHLDTIQAFYYGLNKLDDKQFKTLISMPWPIIQAIIVTYPIKFSDEQDYELLTTKAPLKAIEKRLVEDERRKNNRHNQLRVLTKEQRAEVEEIYKKKKEAEETEKKSGKEGESKKAAEGDKDKK